MIEKLTDKYIDDVMKIWLNENLNAHSFIDENYFINNHDIVKEMIPKAEVYIYKKDEKVIGFIGLDKGYIAGLFIDDNHKRLGIGSKLIDFAKSKYAQLSLFVFKENHNALNFYLKHGFKIISKEMNEDTNHYEYFMEYKKDLT
ncbi:GNAT family N-acetyltransferase [Anaerofustis stercorihominis]|uniref:GNAT family N-acetyltransferase n=1 Tax=Anaerofustis stercorihominis TaxID=214853 RepID=UPI00214C3D12|nr:GNAT family N-acetyltransferase [Anaerofustis stercorihominis]MCR2033665.1 GNAT family N-acetyltransferase [Anaerofustis stercorihominis]